MATVSGFIAKAEKNKFGYWAISVGTGKDASGNTTWANISFKEKGDSLLIGGVEPKKGMLIEAEVEGQYNNFVSGTVKDAPKAGGKGQSGGFKGKGGYDSTGPAVGGAIGRANELMAAGKISSVGAGVVAAASYVASELMKKAVEDGKLGTFCTIMKDVDSLDYKQCIAAKKAYMEAVGSSTSPVEAQADAKPKALAKAPQKAAKPAPAPEPEYQEEEDDCPFGDMPDF